MRSRNKKYFDRALNIIDACRMQNPLEEAAMRARYAGSDTAKMFLVYMLMTDRGMSRNQIVRATGCTYQFVMKTMRELVEAGLVSEDGGRRILTRDEILQFDEPRFRLIATICGQGHRLYTTYDIMALANTKYFNTRATLAGLSRTGAIVRLGGGGSKVDKRTVTYFSPLYAKYVFAKYRCAKCRNTIAIYFPKLIVAGARVMESNEVQCIVCGSVVDPSALHVLRSESY